MPADERGSNHSSVPEEVMTEEQEKGTQAVQEALDRRDNGGPTGR